MGAKSFSLSPLQRCTGILLGFVGFQTGCTSVVILVLVLLSLWPPRHNRSPIVGRLDGLRKDCGGFCQEVERVGSDLNCAGSLCLKVLHCNQFQSLTLTTLYRHIVGICRIVDRLQVAVVILLCRIVVDCVER